MELLKFKIESTYWKNQKQTIVKRETFIYYNKKKNRLRSFHNFDKFRSSEIISKRIFDLLEIIKHVHLIDSIVINDRGRNLEIAMPVYDLDFWKRKNVNKELEHLLFYFTRNYWKFKFYLDKGTYPSQNLTINFKPEEYEVALWSGGLDAYAGFINRKEEAINKKFILASFESSKWKRGEGLQDKLFKSLKRHFSNTQTNRISFKVGGCICLVLKKPE